VCLKSHLPQSTTIPLSGVNVPPPTETSTIIEIGATSSDEVLAISDTINMGETVGPLLLNNISINDVLDDPKPPAAHSVEDESQLKGQNMLDNAIAQAKFPEIRSHVLKDIFPVFSMLYIPQ